MRTAAAISEQRESVFVKKLVWFLLVGVVPLLAAALMIGVALQIVGVPVWKTTQQFLGIEHSNSATPDASPTTRLQLQINQEQAQVNTLKAENAKLQQQLADAKQQSQSLQGQVQSLQTKLSAKQDLQAQAKQEASVLVGMEPAAAAAMLGQLPKDEAGAAVAQMAAADSSQILAAMDPKIAVQILSLAAQYAPSNGTATAANDVSNGTG